MSERERSIRTRLRDDFTHYAEKCLRIRTKAGKVEPLSLNSAQQFIHGRLQAQIERAGKVRAIIVKGRQQGCCLAPETKVLTADLRWVRIDSLSPGDQVVATDEHSSSLAPAVCGGGRGRKMRTAVVEAVVRTRQPAYRITLSDGRSIVSSGMHRWLSRKSQTQWKWRAIDGGRGALRVGDKLRSVTSPWGEPTLDDAWFGGLIDGEGSLDCSPSRTGIRLAVSQRAGAVLDRAVAHCQGRRYGAYIISDDGPRKTKHGRQAVHAVNLSNLGTMFRVMGLSRPVRFIGRQWWVGKSMPDDGEREIASIEHLGVRDVVDIQTSTGTFLAEGLVSHNSTYVEGRYYWKVTHRRGVQAFILTHEQEATNNLFAMVQRYHDHCPALVRPETGAANAKELSFSRLDSGYKVGTAGTKGVGRSQTIQYFHGSEVAFWPFAETHAAGVLQAVPDQPGTEVILESTGNGLGNYFYDQWQKAIRGEGEFEAIFVPWFWQPEYRRDDPEFEMRPDERELAQAYKLDAAQMAWRRFKVVELGSETLFKQEYPMTPEEAFQADTTETLIPIETVRQAVGRDVKPMSGRIIWGVDVARFGDDLSTLAKRRTNWLLEPVKAWKGKDAVQLAGIIHDEYRATPIEERPETIAVDVIGVGAGVVDVLRHMNLPVYSVNVAESPAAQDEFMRLRDELWWKAREWFAARDSRIPEDHALIAELTTVRYGFTTGGKRKVEAKDEMKKRGLKSPDRADAFINTFAVSDLPAARQRSAEPPVFADGV